MKPSPTRRAVLGAGVAVTVGGLSAAGRTRAAAADRVVLTGTVTPENGADVGDDQIQLLSNDSSNSTRTDDDGQFEVELDANAEYRIGYYRSDSGTTVAPRKKGVPHIYELRTTYVGTEDEDLGEFVLPRANVVDIRVLTEDGDPLYGSDITFRHSGWGTGDSFSLNEEGYATIDGASFTGVELAEAARAEVTPPNRGSYEDTTYKRRAAVTGPLEFVVEIGSSGATWSVDRGESPETGTSGKAPKTATGTTTADGTAPPRSSTPRTTTESGAVQGTTRTGTRIGTQTVADSERGFFSNGPDSGALEALEDPFVLTVGGFVLSVAGILHNMMRGH